MSIIWNETEHDNGTETEMKKLYEASGFDIAGIDLEYTDFVTPFSFQFLKKTLPASNFITSTVAYRDASLKSRTIFKTV